MIGGSGGLLDYLISPKVALIIFTLFFIGYIIFLDEEGGFKGKFLHFGPGTTPENTTTFMNIKLNSWPKVIMLYVVGFFSSMLTTYYETVMENNMHSYIWNHAVRKIPYSKKWTYALVTLDPLFYQILSVVQFFANLTLQLQFIIPQFLGSIVADLPFTLRQLTKKQFIGA